MCQQGHPKSFPGQKSMKDIEDLDSVKNKHLMQYQDQFQLPQYVDQKKELLAQPPERVHKTMDKEACKPIPAVLHMNLKDKEVLQSQECQPLEPFRKLLSECEEKLGISDSSNKLTQDISQPQDLQLETKLAFKE